VGIQSEAQPEAFLGWTLRVRRAAAEPARLLLLLHGWTGDEGSMWVFVRQFGPEYWILAPRAPHPAQPGGYSWRPLDAQGRAAPSLADFQPAADGLIELVDGYSAANGPAADQVDLLGFSQGAALTAAVALLHPGRIHRAAMLAGFAPAGTAMQARSRPLQGIPFFVAHGTLDEMVAIETARASIDLLKAAGAAVTFCEDEVGHRLSAGCLRALQSFFR
jgi:phospholipase/carboxylesterase